MSLSLPLQSSDINQRIELEDGWEFLVDRSGRMPLEKAQASGDWRPARVGLSWNVQFEDLRDYMGAAWYRIRFELPQFHDTRHVLLKFGAVDYFCEVCLNGISIGTHEGGYTPFSFEITSAVRPGPNEMLIRVVDPPMNESENRALFPEMMYNEIPHGKQNWYVQNSGIWQGVRLELCPSIHIERLDVSPSVTGEFVIEARLGGIGLTADGGALAEKVRLRMRVYDRSGRAVFDVSQALNASAQIVRINGFVQNPGLWSPDQPELYVLTAELTGAVQYRRRTRFGFRSFEARAGKLYLNGKPFFMRGALDQDFYPETIHTPTSLEYVRDMMIKAKNTGINTLRCHLKVAHPVYLDVADEIGMLIWTELPSWSDSWFPSDHFSTMAAVRADKMFWEILIRDWNHPCIVLQTIMNESWGINLKDASQREWLRTTFDRIKSLLTPLGRLVIDNSACEGNFHVKTDIEDFHQYYSMPDHVGQWDKWLAELASHPAWTFSPYGDAARSGDEPLLVSEFGNWGLPRLPDSLPWWFDLSFGERGVTKPAKVLERFHEFGLDKLFHSFNEMADQTQWHQFISLKHEIESIRSYQSLQGYVITGITDVHWEVNGLLDMWRNEKIYSEDLRTIQSADLIACRLVSHCFYAEDKVDIPVFLSHFDELNLQGARLRWTTSSGRNGAFTIPDEVEAGTVRELCTISLSFSPVDTPTVERLELEVRLRNGARIAENHYDLFVLPRASVNDGIPLSFHTNQLDSMRSGLADSGFDIHAQLHPGALLITSRIDATVASHLEKGGRVLLIADSEDALPRNCPLKVAMRSGTELDGRWFSNFNWIRSDREPFASVAFNPILGFESASVAPMHVIQGVAPSQFDDVLSGISFGWLNNNCALLAQMRAGSGKLVATTYRFDRYGSDPFATELLKSVIRYLMSPDCSPTLEIQLHAFREHPEQMTSIVGHFE